MNLMASNSTMPILGRPLHEAFIYAAEKHVKQGRKGTEIPYLAHLMAVASLVLEAGGDEELAIAALLHDVVEDQGGAPTLEEVRRKFGERVAKIVDECSDTDIEPKPPWRQRKQDYLQRLRSADADTMLVSVADKLHNVRSILTDHRKIGEKVWDRFQGKKEGTLWYYDALSIEFKRLPNDLTAEFEIALTQLHEVAEVSKA